MKEAIEIDFGYMPVKVTIREDGMATKDFRFKDPKALVQQAISSIETSGFDQLKLTMLVHKCIEHLEPKKIIIKEKE